MKKLGWILIVLVFWTCAPKGDPDFLEARQIFDNFDSILSPIAFSKTYYYHKNSEDVWLDENNQPATIDIPYQDHFLAFGTTFAETQKGKGVNTRMVSRFQKGRNTQIFYELDAILFQDKNLTKPIYIVWRDSNKTVIQTKLFDPQGELLQLGSKNFIED